MEKRRVLPKGELVWFVLANNGGGSVYKRDWGIEGFSGTLEDLLARARRDWKNGQGKETLIEEILSLDGEKFRLPEDIPDYIIGMSPLVE